MAFATTSSAFGMKPATPANTSIFGQPKTQNSFFSNPSQQQQQQQQPSTSVFGNIQQAQPTNQPSTSLFGGFGQTQQQQQQQQQQPAPGGFFNQQPQQPQQPQQSLFGGNPLFGGSVNNNPPANANQPAQQQSAFGNFGTFGSTTTQQQGQQQPQQSTGLWGQTPVSNPLQAQPTLPAGGFGNFGLGGQQKQQQQLQPQLQQQQQQQQSFGLQPPLFTKSTKFNDLPDELKKVLENIDSHIQGRIQISKDLHQRKLGEEAIKGQELTRSVHKQLVNTSSTIHADLLLTRDLKAKADQAVQDTIVATRIVDGFRNPQQSGANLKTSAGFPLEYFTRVTKQMRERLAWYKSTIEQIERKLSSTTSHTQYTPHAISTTLQAQNATFIALASKTAALEAELQKLKTIYTQLWRAKTGSMRDPFNDLDRNTGEDFGLNSLNVT